MQTSELCVGDLAHSAGRTDPDFTGPRRGICAPLWSQALTSCQPHVEARRAGWCPVTTSTLSASTLSGPTQGHPKVTSVFSFAVLLSGHRQVPPPSLQAADVLTSALHTSKSPQACDGDPGGAVFLRGPGTAWVESRGCPQRASLPPLQDEMELGYVEAPHKTFPVVFDSPRNGELQEFPYKRILVSGCYCSPAQGSRGHHPKGRAGERSPGNRTGSPSFRDGGTAAGYKTDDAQSHLNFKTQPVTLL